MTTRTINLGGTYIIAGLTSTHLQLASPTEVNPNWSYANLDGAGTSGYEQNISIVLVPQSDTLDFSGSGYTVSAVTPTQITLSSPATINPHWGFLGGFIDAATAALSANISTTNNANWIGPFIVEGSDTSLLVANFVAAGGLYKDNGKKQVAFPITVQIEATPVNALDVPIGAPQTFSVTIEGNASGRDSHAATLVCELATPGRQSVRARRTTLADLNFKGTVVDTVKWQDLYGIAAVPVSHFGNVTTVHSRTYATEGALAVKERKLNMLATRRVPIRTSGTTFGAAAGTKNAAEIFAAACLDPYIGGRAMGELDLDSIYGAVAETVDYFGAPEAGEFSATFDDDNISFEETAATIANAVFCTAFRQASKIGMALERAKEDSELLFNHRNKVPGSETRTVRFGNLDENDGVEVEWTDPTDDATATIYIPADRSATKPRQIKGIGIRTGLQAYWTAWRAWNKIRYQNTSVEFTALQEAAVVARNSRVLIADNTRPETQDGEIVAQAGLQLQTSQPTEFEAGVGYTIFLQLPDGTVDSMSVVAGTDDFHVLIARAPRAALALADDQCALPGYQIVRNDSPRTDAFLIAEREAESNFTYTVRAINYSPMYYANDQLALDLAFLTASFADSSAFQRDGVGVSGATTVVDSDRAKRVFSGPGGAASVTFASFSPPESYTKAAWVKRDDLTTAGSILSSANESFGFAAGPDLQAGHGGVAVNAPWPAAGAWHFAAVAYDADEGTLALYIDGELADSASGVATRVLAQLVAFGGLKGRADDLRLVGRALSDAEVRALYRASRL